MVFCTLGQDWLIGRNFEASINITFSIGIEDLPIPKDVRKSVRTTTNKKRGKDPPSNLKLVEMSVLAGDCSSL